MVEEKKKPDTVVVEEKKKPELVVVEEKTKKDDQVGVRFDNVLSMPISRWTKDPFQRCSGCASQSLTGASEVGASDVLQPVTNQLGLHVHRLCAGQALTRLLLLVLVTEHAGGLLL